MSDAIHAEVRTLGEKSLDTFEAALTLYNHGAIDALTLYKSTRPCQIFLQLTAPWEPDDHPMEDINLHDAVQAVVVKADRTVTKEQIAHMDDYNLRDVIRREAVRKHMEVYRP